MVNSKSMSFSYVIITENYILNAKTRSRQDTKKSTFAALRRSGFAFRKILQIQNFHINFTN